MSAFREMINNSFQGNFDTTFMGNRKNCQNINYFFSHKNFLNELLIITLRACLIGGVEKQEDGKLVGGQKRFGFPPCMFGWNGEKVGGYVEKSFIWLERKRGG